MSKFIPEMTSAYIQIKNLRLHYLSSQSQLSSLKQPLQTIVFLHGFPEHSGVWRKQLSYFGNDFRAIALDLPGYNLSQAPSSLHEFSVPNLVSVIAEFIKIICQDSPIVLVAHDWGGALAWPLASRFPELIDKLVIINAAHPSTFTREMIENQHQRILSDYIHDFLESNAEDQLSSDDFAALKAHSIDKFRIRLSVEDIAAYKRAWSRPNSITNMLNYYRAMPQLFPRENPVPETLNRAVGAVETPERPLNEIKIPNIRISMPTLVLWGDNDQAFDVQVLDGLSEYIDDYTECRFADASHWLHHEKPDEVNQAIAAFLKAKKGKGSV